MNITILGTGNMAKGLASVFAAGGYDVILGSRDAEPGERNRQGTGARVKGDGLAAAANKSDVVVLAVPFDAAAETIAAAGGLAGKVLVDISNPLTPDYMGLTVGHSTSAAEEIQKLAPKAKVVKLSTRYLRPSCKAVARLEKPPLRYSSQATMKLPTRPSRPSAARADLLSCRAAA